ncbi:MAG: NAD(P)/FAD-dependent oxidoreductase [Ruminococcaceae bacterium]|nr:NAD(P)/FAD-dependent oxidoreductase [Oscillospiraceae bacterium]
MEYDVIVIGGGAAGMMAAGTAAHYGARVLLLEKNEKPGKKLFITGKGRCNVTNAAPINEFMEQIPSGGRFLYSAFSTFDNESLLQLLKEYGVETKVERGGRVFPMSDKSSDIIRALSRYAGCEKNARFKTKVQTIIIEENQVMGVTLTDGSAVRAPRVIVSTGGMSYPQTGSDGDGYRFAKAAGHLVIEPRASLVPLEAMEAWPRELMGLSLKNVSLTALDQHDKVLFKEIGELLFTHFGLSGPLVLSASAHLRAYDKQKYRLVIDLKPALSVEQLDARILRDFSQEINKDYVNSLDALLPKKLIPVIARLSAIPLRKKVNEVTREERQRLVSLLKSLTVTVKKPRPIAEAIITAGGVHLKEIAPKTMESRLVKGLYFAGEVLDLDAYTGGYNLQIAFSTGYLAGMHAAIDE